MPQVMQTIATTAATTLTFGNHAETIVTLSSTTGRIITLPASAGTGKKFHIFIGTTVSSGNHVIAVANGTDVMAGVLSVATDIAGVTVNTTATDDTITMTGSTTGGVKGSFVHLTDVVSGVWAVEGALISTGSEATPFSAAVS